MRIALSVLLVVSLVGCGKKKEAGDTSSSETKTVELDTSQPGKVALNGPAVDTCATLTKDQIKAVIGEEPKDPKQYIEPAGSELGDCSWTSASYIVQIHARPANEFDGSVEMLKDAKPIEGIGEKAVMTGAQVFVKLSGKPYFLLVMVAGPTNAPAQDAEKRITEMAKVVVAAAK
jgi:hypothetical protein